MAQFDVHRTQGSASSVAPYLVELQSDLMQARALRVVAPLYRARDFGPAIRTLHIPVFMDGEDHVLAVDELAALPLKVLGPVVASLAAQRAAIISALDLLFTGF